MTSALISALATIGVAIGGIRYMAFGPRRRRRPEAQNHVVRLGLFERVILLVGALRRPQR